MSERKARVKIPINRTPALIDPLSFGDNSSSLNAAKRLSKNVEFNIDLWFDKHYHDRVYKGDDNGPREGIEEKKIEKLVLSSIKFLFHFASTHSTFSFCNNRNDTNFRKLRVILREINDSIALNVVIECHYLSNNTLEITVKTAMAENDFYLSDNQYCIEIEGDSATLIKHVNGKENIISEI